MNYPAELKYSKSHEWLSADGVVGISDFAQEALGDVVVNELHCDNPRCISSTEQELDQVFKIVEPKERICRCIYCESKGKM